MCGRYALNLRPSQIRQMLQDDDMPVEDAPSDEGDGAPRQSYNFAPGYHGVVYRADVPDWGAGPSKEAKTKSNHDSNSNIKYADIAGDEDVQPAHGKIERTTTTTTPHYKLQSMKWGLIPFWTKRNPDYASMMKTINCRDDSLAQSGGMWSSMKGRKRCVVVAQGFYEWLTKGKEKIAHFVKRQDGKLMCLAGLWDCVQYEGGTTAEENKNNYTYTIITTDSNKQLKFLHDRMPVILDQNSERLWKWLDPGSYEWSKDLQDILRPFEGELEVYPVSKEVGKVGNNSPTFIVPVASRENKSNIANFFANAAKTKTTTADESVEDTDDGGNCLKRKAEDDPAEEGRPLKKETTTPNKKTTAKMTKTISSTSNGTKSPSTSKAGGTPKITKFFGNSA